VKSNLATRLRFIPPLLLFAAAVAALVPVPGGIPYWPLAGLWATGLAVFTPTALGNALARPAVILAVLLAMPVFGLLVGSAPALQFALLPPAAFLLAVLTLGPGLVDRPLLRYGLAALLADGFIAVSGLGLYYLDRIAGTELVPTNDALMWHLTAGLLGVGAMYVLSAGLALRRET